MTRTLEEVLAALPEERRNRIQKAAEERATQIRGLRALRALTEMSQKDMALVLGIKPPSVCKMEKQADIYLSTLRKFVEAAGGRLELRVILPNHEPIQLTDIGELVA
jgi:DNA-binding XRE family transcriptional regulator